ncbi:MAG: hypothetical protein HY892_11300 [Deltaproteobacteria bacterium]|nr:hypothetical protein [Deltaproteobacteria bacterium]
MKKIGCGALVLWITVLLSAAYGADHNISLEYKPNTKVKRSPATVPGHKIFFGEFRDQRANPRQVGENLEDKEKRVIVVVSDPHGAGHLVRAALSKEFGSKGFSVVGGPGLADKIIEGTLVKFWTVETNRYNSQTQLRLDVRDKSGGVVFSRTYSGSGKNFGRSLSETNYNESISDSLTMIVDALFTDSEFLRALSEKAPPVRMEDKKPPVAPPAPSPPSPPPVKTAEPGEEYLFHRVFAGETMATIAKYYSGNANNWKILASHNLDKEPFKLRADEVIKIPRSLAIVNKDQPGFSTASSREPAGRVKKPAAPAATPAAPAPPPPVTGPAFGPK